MSYLPENPLLRLSDAAQAQIQTHHSMATECTFKLGGAADYFFAPYTAEALADLLRVAQEFGLPYLILGGGSNVLFRDNGFPGLVISTRNFNACEVLPDSCLRVGAGVGNQALTARTLELGLSGFEWAAGLPGTVGGGVYMNAKCYGGCFANQVEEVTALTPTGEIKVFSAKECDFNYKHSVFQTKPLVILSAKLKFSEGDPKAMEELQQKNIQDRNRKHQFDFPSAGCIFKNAYSINQSAGTLIEACGLKGRRVGRVRVFEHHANFIINEGQGKAADVLTLMGIIQEAVEMKHKVLLEPEIRIIPGK